MSSQQDPAGDREVFRSTGSLILWWLWAVFAAFALEGMIVVLLSQFGRDPLAFVVLTALMFLCYGEIYSLFPATCGDTYGRKFASANAGLLYTAKGMASLLVPLSSVIVARPGSSPGARNTERDSSG